MQDGLISEFPALSIDMSSFVVILFLAAETDVGMKTLRSIAEGMHWFLLQLEPVETRKQLGGIDKGQPKGFCCKSLFVTLMQRL